MFWKSDGDPDSVYSLSHRVYGVRNRKGITRRMVQDTVNEMLEGRDDLDVLRIRSIDVDAVSSVWSTPYEVAFPQEGA